ncbi:hypothetical protein ACT3CD_16245 [Geofilum sp. OHC36d9]|uniref:hypothetical protein n=1 Tax=Geofilum sp. OHC36d9 TaxID=3458413 RepID=UPI004034AA8A
MKKLNVRGLLIAQSPVLGTTITISRLKRRGYISMPGLHLSLNPSRYEPPYMHQSEKYPVNILNERWEQSSRTYGGLRGSPPVF